MTPNGFQPATRAPERRALFDLQRRIAQLEEEAAAAAAAAAAPWINVTFQNGFTSDSSSPVQYRKVGDNVFIRGRANGSTQFVPMFTLPVGYRPPKELVISSAGVASSFWVHAMLYILSTGEVELIGSVVTVATNASFSTLA
jgi:hypothetical protein